MFRRKRPHMEPDRLPQSCTVEGAMPYPSHPGSWSGSRTKCGRRRNTKNTNASTKRHSHRASWEQRGCPCSRWYGTEGVPHVGVAALPHGLRVSCCCSQWRGMALTNDGSHVLLRRDQSTGAPLPLNYLVYIRISATYTEQSPLCVRICVQNQLWISGPFTVKCVIY